MKFRVFAVAVALVLAGAAQAQDRPTMTIAVPGVHPSLEPIAGNSTDASRVLPNIFDQIVTRNFAEDPEGGRTQAGHRDGMGTGRPADMAVHDPRRRDLP
jgi:hypothetical protein